MLEATCPQCGAAIRFRSADLPIRICDYCRSAVLRMGDDLEAIGTVAQVPDDVSPLQIGVTGRDGAQGFTLVGRVRWRWTDGAWNEWLALFDDGTHGWLGESMGRYMMLRQIATPQRETGPLAALALGGSVLVGQQAKLGETTYRVADIRTVTCVASEGELPFPAQQGLEIVSIDLMTADGQCASIQKEAEAVLVYVGRYVTLAEIRAGGLRAFEGWPMPRYA